VMAEGAAVVDELKDEDVIDDISEYAQELAEFLRDESGLTVNQIGPMLQMFFTKDEVNCPADVEETDEEDFKKYQRALLDEGVFIAPSRWESMFVSSAHSDEDLETTKEAVSEALDGIQI
ncbi:MAG: aspartate aminotransferase family protein, partial [Candidatus Aenigmatarchaeota archaeon]